MSYLFSEHHFLDPHLQLCWNLFLVNCNSASHWSSFLHKVKSPALPDLGSLERTAIGERCLWPITTLLLMSQLCWAKGCLPRGAFRLTVWRAQLPEREDGRSLHLGKLCSTLPRRLFPILLNALNMATLCSLSNDLIVKAAKYIWRAI